MSVAFKNTLTNDVGLRKIFLSSLQKLRLNLPLHWPVGSLECRFDCEEIRMQIVEELTPLLPIAVIGIDKKETFEITGSGEI
jgi:hypothetical protein